MNEAYSKPPVSFSIAAPGVAVITIDRPARRNALNLEVKRLLTGFVLQLGADDGVKVIVLTGAGAYFVAGTDIDEMLDMTPTSHTLNAMLSEMKRPWLLGGGGARESK